MSLRMRRGSSPAPPAGAFGPLPSEQTIRDGAQPNVVTDPGGGITFTSRADLQTKINANPANSIFVGAGNTTYNWDASISTSTKHPRIYFLGNPENCVINMGGLNLEGAINGAANPNGGEVHGGKFRNSGSGSSEVAHGLAIGAGWLAEDVICEDNFGIGLASGSNSAAYTVRRAIIRNNGRYGMNMTQNAVNVWGPKGCLLEDVQISGNNTRHLGVGGNAGGTKFSAGVRDSIWRRMWVHDNYGSGLWWDGAHSGNLVEDCVIENNRNWGMFVELGWGSSIFRRLFLKDNSVAAPTDPNNLDLPDWFRAVQFLVSCVDGTLVANDAGAYNTSTGGGTGIIVRDNVIDGVTRAMGAITHEVHPVNTKDIHFLHNQVWLRNSTAITGGSIYSAQVGGMDTDPVQILWNEIIEFDDNEYHVANTAADYWRWAGSGNGDPRDWIEWRAFGKDTDSTMVAI